MWSSWGSVRHGWIVPGELWSLIEPLLPEPASKPLGGGPRSSDRQALCGVLFVLRTGIQWEYLTQELGPGSEGDRLVGVWDQLHQVLLRSWIEEALDWAPGGDRLLPRASCLPGPNRAQPARPCTAGPGGSVAPAGAVHARCRQVRPHRRPRPRRLHRLRGRHSAGAQGVPLGRGYRHHFPARDRGDGAGRYRLPGPHA
ncbi:transposase [Streptomyces sp. NPDC101225]|uniref:transposase n=1 Tax=Streptomyces sp. NPDC101225 TaxID=3366135 RepID=UPI00382938F2